MDHHSHQSLAEVHETVDTTKVKKGWRRLFAFIGPAYLVSVGYMDPGNWATDIAGGSQFGYSLIWVLLMSNLMAILLQGLSARLGLVRGRDLAQASRETYSKPVNFVLYLLAEIAIAACDLAEVLGMAIGLQLLFGLPLVAGVLITVLDTFLLLFLINNGIRKMEAFIFGLVSVIGMAFLTEMFFAKPDIVEVGKGMIPSIPGETALYIAIGIIGATVMPHNLYLHSSLVQTRKFERTESGIKTAIKYNRIDSTIALNLAFFVNAAILILAASTFYKNAMYDVAEIQDAHKFLQPLLGNEWAPRLFAIALIAAGQSSTVTGTLAGQIVMEGYLNLRIAPWLRRIITRLIAVIPALIAILYFGEESTGRLLILSQVILSLQLGFAVIPLIHMVSNKQKMGKFRIKPLVRIIAWICALIIVGLNGKMVYNEVSEWIIAHPDSVALKFIVVPIVISAAGLLVYIALHPFFVKETKAVPTIHRAIPLQPDFKSEPFKRIAVALDFSGIDQKNITSAIAQGGMDAEYLLIHVQESAGALFFNQDVRDMESINDEKHLLQYASQLATMGYKVKWKIGFGNPKKAIPEIVEEYHADLLVMGAHGHRAVKDLVLGTTVDAVRHRVSMTVMIVR